MNTNGIWIETYSGKHFHFLNPRPEDICIEDVARALSMQCRYTGHTKFHYSIATHCVLLSDYVGKQKRVEGGMAQYATLMHDASEAYLGDVSRPLKGALPQYRRIERIVEKALIEHFKIPFALPPWIKEFDTRILQDERAALMPNSRGGWADDGMEPLGIKIPQWTPKRSRVEFMLRYDKLLEQIKKRG